MGRDWRDPSFTSAWKGYDMKDRNDQSIQGHGAIPFAKVLIANRGEIACRIIRTLDALGIASVAIFHRAERKAKHARLAGEAIEIHGASPIAAHLDAAQIVRLALECGADAVHPGYGFLSENATFAQQVADAGLTFIGPDAATIRLMGDKISARNFAESHGVPVAPSVMPTEDVADFVAAAEKIGFPLLIKAAAGGGGKGMSIVRAAGELEEAARIAASEALRYFSDGRVYAETYVERPRHIEVQVLGDGLGGAIHLLERECSVQRRFQKVIEEAPAANLPAGLRDDICAAAVKLASAARYKNAGTVEFILGADGRFFFLEMNTRLQVEHPVTEMITGLDLVAEQIAIAAGRGLRLTQDQVVAHGHSIECRICAEDPDNNFMPATGTIQYLGIPEAPHIRFENALDARQKVTADFDPMLAKLVVHGDDRAMAIARMVAALDELALLGVRTNTDFLSRVLRHDAFARADLHTGFIPEHAEDLARKEPGTELLDKVLIAAALGYREFHDLAFGLPEPHATIGLWRN